MASPLYCWRCDKTVPMLDETEWPAMERALSIRIENMQKFRLRHGASLVEASQHEHGQEALRLYETLTGQTETNSEALSHHRLSIYGPPCRACGKPLRTTRAKLCAACGVGRA